MEENRITISTKQTKGKVKELSKYEIFAKDYFEAVEDLKNDTTFKEMKQEGEFNFDRPTVNLKGYRIDMLNKAISKISNGELEAHKEYYGGYYLTLPNRQADQNRRTYQAEYIAEALKAKGYEASVIYQLD